MKKNISKISGLLLLGVFALTSCKKTVTPRKLDGEWTVTSGSGSSNSTSLGSRTTTFDGAKETTISGGTSTVQAKTISYSFDKKAGTYSNITVKTDTDTDETITFAYYSKSGTEYTEEGDFIMTTVSVSTTTEDGTFTITGGTGDIEKNTQIVLAPTSTVINSVETYSYKDDFTSASISASTHYTRSGNSFTGYIYTVLPTNATVTTTDTGVTYYPTVLTVTSLKKGVMEVEMKYSNVSTTTSGTASSSTTAENSYTLTEK